MILFIIIILYYYHVAYMYDTHGNLEHSKININNTDSKTYTEYEIMEIIEKHKNKCLYKKCHVNEMKKNMVDGAIVGFLAGILVGSYENAVESALTWSLIRGIITGHNFDPPQYINKP